MQEYRKTDARIKLSIFVLMCLFFLVLANLFRVQVLEGKLYVEKTAEKFPKVKIETITLYRGAVLDRNGKELAVSIPTVSVYAFPRLVRNKEELARRLSAVLNMEESSMLDRLNSDKKFVWIAEGVNKEYKNLIHRVIRETDNTQAVGIQDDVRRYYPHGYLAGNLIGFVGRDGKGLEGLEYALENRIGGKGVKKFFFAGGRMALEPYSEESLKVDDVKTTIDIGVQMVVEDIRDHIVRAWNPRRVAILVMDVNTGDILALATYPYYDPNLYWKYESWQRRNYAVTDIFEPGSTMKPFFIGKALDKGYVSENFGTSIGEKAEVYGRYVKDVHVSHFLTLDQILTKSSNIGTIKVAKYLSKKDVQELFRELHFNDTFGVLPGETKPKLPNLNYPANLLYASIGQGLAVNLLSLTTAFIPLATNKLIKPRMLLDEEPQVRRERVFSERTFAWLRRNMIKVVEEGTAKLARSEYFYIAGKTGTSQKFDFRTGRYSRDKVVAYFVGYFPATNPRFVAGIMVDEPKGPNPHGGTVAAPYFKELVERVCAYYRLHPDKPNNPLPNR